jgi:hypothetical protein
MNSETPDELVIRVGRIMMRVPPKEWPAYIGALVALMEHHLGREQAKLTLQSLIDSIWNKTE